mmetsp:Transcript_9390/g.11254  ORF Transcript_9390/g.11254 Transcript_9390/m.11254 type:complete len:227 (+) Transcript_9390:86-766(+)
MANGKEAPVFFGSPTLEGYFCNNNQSSTPNGRTCCIVMHPHPKLGGNCDNNVVIGVTKSLVQAGYSTLRFNFRGVGASKGSSSWKGVAEREDVKSAIDFARSNEEIERIIIVGYSFGSAVSLAISADEKYNSLVDLYVLIAYPRGFITSFIFQSHYNLAKTTKPKYFIIGNQDNFTSVSKLEKFVDGLPGPKEIAVVEGADHFFLHRESEVARKVIEWINGQDLQS